MLYVYITICVGIVMGVLVFYVLRGLAHSQQMLQQTRQQCYQTHTQAVQALEQALAQGEISLVDYEHELQRLNSHFEGKPDELLAQAQALDPTNLDVLMLTGQSALQKRRYQQALDFLIPLKKNFRSRGRGNRMATTTNRSSPSPFNSITSCRCKRD